MLKKYAIFFALSVFLILSCGCETAKGAFKGGSEGAKKDWENLRSTESFLAKADAWIRKNLW
ncbi:MAG: hypothetical protein ABIH75_00540 [Candidatus Omnitrophota bacterium]